MQVAFAKVDNFPTNETLVYCIIKSFLGKHVLISSYLLLASLIAVWKSYLRNNRYAVSCVIVSDLFPSDPVSMRFKNSLGSASLRFAADCAGFLSIISNKGVFHTFMLYPSLYTTNALFLDDYGEEHSPSHPLLSLDLLLFEASLYILWWMSLVSP